MNLLDIDKPVRRLLLAIVVVVFSLQIFVVQAVAQKSEKSRRLCAGRRVASGRPSSIGTATTSPSNLIGTDVN